MPQIQILPEAPGFGSQLGEALGGGIGQGIQQGISARLTNMLQTKQELGKARGSVMSFLKRYGKDHGYSPDAITGIEDRAKKFIQAGYSANDASQAAFQEYNQSLPPTEPEKGFFEKHFGIGKEVNQEAREGFMDWLKKTGQDVKGALAKFGYPFVEHAESILDLFSPNNAAIDDLRRQGYTDEEIAQSLQEIQGSLPSFLRTGENEKSLMESYLEATGGVGPGENKLERDIQAALSWFSPAGAVAQEAKEAAAAAGGGPLVQTAADFIGLVAGLKGLPGLKNIKLPSLKANQKILRKAEQVAAKTGQKVEEVIHQAQQESGADLNKAIGGDATEINKLSRSITREAPEVAQKVSSAKKEFFNKKQALKEREVFGSKLPAHPFEEYYAVEARAAAKEASKTPPTLAKEAEITARLKPLEEGKYTQLKQQRASLQKLENDAKSVEGANKARVEALASFKRKDIQKTLEELKDIQYELKYFRKRPTEAQMAHDASERVKELVHEIKNPTPAGQKKIRDGLKADQKILDAAEATMKRGELPGEIRPDTYMKINEKYLDAYTAQIAELKEANKALRGRKDTEALKELSENKITLEHLQHRQNVLKAKIANQRDKIKAMRAIEGPSGAFYRNQLKSAQNTVAEFQKDFFQKPKVKSEVQLKTQKIAQKEIKNVQEATKLGEETGKHPTTENIEKGAALSGEKPKDLKGAIEELKTKMGERAQKLENGKATELDIQGSRKQISRILKIKRNVKAAAGHFLVGSVVGVLENEFGQKIPRTYLYGAAAIAGHPTKAGGRFIGYSVGNKLVDYIYNSKESSNLKKLRNNPNEYTKYVQNLRKRYSPKRVKEIVDSAKKS